MFDRTSFRPPALLLAAGFTTYVLVTLIHPGGAANHHEVIFEHYAESHTWLPVHLGQFVGMALVVVGLLALGRALVSDVRRRGASAARVGEMFATVSLGLYAVLQAVDGVALKQAVDAWAQAPAADRATRFANAETVRWLEWGVRSYQCAALGAALVLLAVAVLRSAHLPRAVGVLMALSGAAYLVQGWTLGAGGFSSTNTVAILVGYLLTLAWIGALAVIAWRRTGRPTRRGPAAAAGGNGSQMGHRVRPSTSGAPLPTHREALHLVYSTLR